MCKLQAKRDLSSHRLAQRLEDDIRLRRLAAGDRYLNAEQAAKLLGVSTTTAHRALKVLADRKVVERRTRHGTFITIHEGCKPVCRIRTVYVLMRVEWEEIGYRTFGPILMGIRRSIPGVNVQFSFVPVQDGARYVQELIGLASARGEMTGVVAMSCGREVYQVLAAAGVPAVVSGSLYPGDSPLPSIDMDNRESGRLLTEYLVNGGHRRLAFVSTMDIRPGENDLFDGISGVLTARGLPHDALTVRWTPHHPEALHAVVRSLLAAPDPPTGFIARGIRGAELIVEALHSPECRPPQGSEVVYTAHTVDEGMDQLACTYVQTIVTHEERAQRIAELLTRAVAEEVSQDDRVVLPVILRRAR